MKTIALTLLLAFAMTSHAQVPGAFNYQGYLADTSGAPVDDMTSMTFILYSQANGGVSLWATAQDVPVSQGLFSVTLGGEGAALPPQVFDGPLYLEVIVNGETLQPRRPLQSAPFALKARDADTIGGLTAEDLDQSDEIAQFQSALGEIHLLPSGFVDEIPILGNQPQFVGDLIEMTIEQDQRLFYTLTVALGLANSFWTARVPVGLCAQALGGGGISFATAHDVDLNGLRQAITVSGGTGPLNAGTWKLGPCVLNDSSYAIANNGLVTGWIVKAN